MSKSCQARQYSDQMQCARCGLAWDMNDPEPPECLTDEQINRQQGRKVLDELKARLSDDPFANIIHRNIRRMVNTGERLSRILAKRLPAGPERDKVLEIAEALHDLGCRL